MSLLLEQWAVHKKQVFSQRKNDSSKLPERPPADKRAKSSFSHTSGSSKT